MRRLWILMAVTALVAAACGTADASNEATGQVATAEGPSASLIVADSTLGSILVDGAGNTLYLFTPDNRGESVCYDQCEATWPPLVGDIQPGDGIDASLLGTAIRTDGSEQVTFNGWPLYYFANDTAPGDTNGQAINDVWYVVTGAGEALGSDTLEGAALGSGTLEGAALGSDGY